MNLIPSGIEKSHTQTSFFKSSGSSGAIRAAYGCEGSQVKCELIKEKEKY